MNVNLIVSMNTDGSYHVDVVLTNEGDSHNLFNMNVDYIQVTEQVRDSLDVINQFGGGE
jgi:hypothetical protein